MKLKKITYLVLILTSFTFVACSSGSEETQNKDGIEYTSDYICPMHCEGSGSESAGICPNCGMDYRENPNKKKTEKNHTHDDDTTHEH
jgi:hypothetical protein